jgi:hypothetical protein
MSRYISIWFGPTPAPSIYLHEGSMVIRFQVCA